MGKVRFITKEEYKKNNRKTVRKRRAKVLNLFIVFCFIASCSGAVYYALSV